MENPTKRKPRTRSGQGIADYIPKKSCGAGSGWRAQDRREPAGVCKAFFRMCDKCILLEFGQVFGCLPRYPLGDRFQYPGFPDAPEIACRGRLPPLRHIEVEGA